MEVLFPSFVPHFVLPCVRCKRDEAAGAEEPRGAAGGQRGPRISVAFNAAVA